MFKYTINIIDIRTGDTLLSCRTMLDTASKAQTFAQAVIDKRKYGNCIIEISQFNKSQQNEPNRKVYYFPQ